MDLVRSNNLKEFSGKREREKKNICVGKQEHISLKLTSEQEISGQIVVQEWDDVILLERIPTPSLVASNSSREKTTRGRVQQMGREDRIQETMEDE